MKKIINSKMYNTETAKSLGDYWNGYGKGDFNYVLEKLYQKKTNEYFLYAEGGALSKWRLSKGGCWGYGETIIPFSDEEAKEWAEEKLDAELFCELFGEPEE